MRFRDISLSNWKRLQGYEEPVRGLIDMYRDDLTLYGVDDSFPWRRYLLQNWRVRLRKH